MLYVFLLIKKHASVTHNIMCKHCSPRIIIAVRVTAKQQATERRIEVNAFPTQCKKLKAEQINLGIYHCRISKREF